MFLFDEKGRPKTITAQDLEPKIEDFISNYKEIMDLNSKNFIPEVPNPHDFHYRESMNNRNDGFSVVGKKEKIKKKPYKHSCPPMSEEAEKKEIMQAKKDLDEKLQEKIEDLERWDNKAKSDVEKWFASSDEISRQILLSRTKKMQALLSTYTIDNFKPAEDFQREKGQFAYVYDDDDSTVYFDSAFCDAPATGRDSKMGSLAHEMSHFKSIGSTEDFEYGDDAIDLVNNPIDGESPIYNADNYEYYIEN